MDEFVSLYLCMCEQVFLLNLADGCHIEIHPSSQDATDYYNYKGWYSTVLLALADARYYDSF